MVASDNVVTASDKLIDVRVIDTDASEKSIDVHVTDTEALLYEERSVQAVLASAEAEKAQVFGGS